VQVSVAGYPDTLREYVDIDDDMRILCGVVIGHSDPQFPANALTVPRNSLEKNFVFKDS
jgi:hypothetical protein